MSLADYVRKKVSPSEYYSRVFGEIRWPDAIEARVLCVFHSEKTPSLHLNKDTGAFYCHGCSAAGRSIVKFHSEANKVSHEDAASQIYSEFIHPTIEPRKVRQWKRLLAQSQPMKSYIEGRMVSDEVRDRMNLGYNGRRIVFPIYDRWGQVINTKQYDVDAKAKGRPKMINYRDPNESRSFGSPTQLYPFSSFAMAKETCNGRIVLCEGEWDTLALISIGIAAITCTAGVKSWNDEYNEDFRGLDVVIAYDNDKDGNRFWTRPLKALRSIAKAVYRIKIPKHAGKDVSDWMKGSELMRSADAWEAKMDKLQPELENPDSVVDQDVREAPLDIVVSDSSLIEREVKFKARIAGESMTPFVVPHTARVSCKKTCDTCPMQDTDHEFKEVTITPNELDFLEYVGGSKSSIMTKLKNKAGFSFATPECGCQVEVVSRQYLTQLILNPAIGSGHRRHVTANTLVPADLGTLPTREYTFEGRVLPDPNNQLASIVAPRASISMTDVEAFELSPRDRKRLSALFSVSSNNSLEEKIKEIADWQWRNITKIPGRSDLHISVDLVFHSVKSFSLNGMRLKRGMLDILVLGDSATGKGSIAEGLLDYYGLGQVASGEGSTYAGLVAAVESIGKQWIIRWGLLPMNNGRLVLIDEMSSMSVNDIGKLTRIRSEGVAESTKVRNDRAEALTRMIWLSNTRTGRLLSSYPYGVVAAKELIGAVEDIRRFDYILFIGDDEVNTDEINTFTIPNTDDSDKFDVEAFRNLILWAWSRTEDQIKFTDVALKTITEESIFLMEKYPACDIPLIQGANIRFKIAKIAAAIAARVYSCDKSGEKLIVKQEHVKYASMLIDTFYSKPTAGYDRYSTQAGIREKEKLARELDDLLSNDTSLLMLLGSVSEVSPDTLANVTSGDPMIARRLLSTLVSHRAVNHIRGSQYSVNPEFIKWLGEFEQNRTKAKRKK
jgi:hypothetical protein